MEKHLIAPSADIMEKIRADLSAIVPPAEITLAHGGPRASIKQLALHIAYAASARGKTVVFLDGANSFDPFLISGLARSAGLVPEELLGRIHISRAFTCHQMQALIVERLGDRLGDASNRPGASVAIVSGLLDTFYDESVQFSEARKLLESATAELARLAGRGARIFITCPDSKLPLASKQKRFLDLMKKISHSTIRIEEETEEAPFALEGPGLGRDKYRGR
jgi:hypothetical protein